MVSFVPCNFTLLYICMVARPPLLAGFPGLPTLFNKVDFAYIQPGFNDWSSKQGEYVVSVFVNIFSVSNSFWGSTSCKGSCTFVGTTSLLQGNVFRQGTQQDVRSPSRPTEGYCYIKSQAWIYSTYPSRGGHLFSLPPAITKPSQ